MRAERDVSVSNMTVQRHGGLSSPAFGYRYCSECRYKHTARLLSIDVLIVYRRNSLPG